MIKISDYITDVIPEISGYLPWDTCRDSKTIISELIKRLPDTYILSSGVAVHKSAVIENGAVLKPPIIIGDGCFIASYAYLRGGVWLDKNVIIGPSTEIKSSFIFSGSKAAHFNFIGDSIIGRSVNIEAGAIIANYRNELEDKEITCSVDKHKVRTGVNKFGSLIGDKCRIGANSVLAPGTILKPNSIVKRLELVDQLSY